MAKPKSTVTEYRNYYLPIQFPVLLHTGEQWKLSDPSGSRLHFHNCLEIGICHSERGCLEFLGEMFPFQEGDVTVVPKNVPHSGYSTSDENSRWSYLYLDPQELFREMLPATWKNHDLSPYFFPGYCPVFSREEHPKIYYLATAVVRELEEQKANYPLSVRGLLLSLYIEIFRLESETKNGGGAESAAAETAAPSEIAGSLAITPALDFIEHNYMQQFTVEQLANLCHWSTTHFRRVFHNTMGTSPLEFVNSTRISKACALLCSTEESVLNISETVGFHSVSSFNRAFLKLMQMSPRDYRKQIQKNETSKPAYDTAPASSHSFS